MREHEVVSTLPTVKPLGVHKQCSRAYQRCNALT